jgi:hypothetical protein
LDGTTGAQLAALENFSIIAAGANPQVNNTATAQPDGWFLLTRNLTPTSSTGTYRFQLLGNQQQTLDVLVWHPQAEVGATPTAYQRVTTAFDVTEQGQRDCFGVRADGTDDGYETAGNVDFSGTNKVTVFAAVRKRSDSLTQTVVELSVNSDTNNGSFWLRAPAASGANSYRFTSRGTSTQSAGTGAFAPAPDIAIVTSEADISSPFVRLRRNGTLIEQVTASQGTGNYGNYQMFLCARAGTSNLLNGDIFALIIAGGSYPLSTIQRVERLLSRITPTVNL